MAISSSTKTSVACVVTFVLYIIYTVFIMFGLYEERPNLYSNTEEKVLIQRQILLFPTLDTFSIFVVNYVWQFIWLVYCLTCICRHNGLDMLSTKFFVFYVMRMVFSLVATVTWWKNQMIATFILMIFFVIFMELSFAVASYDLQMYHKSERPAETTALDSWCRRWLIQNGILFDVVVTNIIFILVTGIFLHYELGASDFSVSLGLLILLGVLTFAWFIAEQSVLKKYTVYTFSLYIAVIYFFSGLVIKVWDEDKTIGGFAVFFLVATCIIFIIRCFLAIITNHSSIKRGSYENITYSSNAQTVNVEEPSSQIQPSTFSGN
jgi:hypothetical protein